MRAGDRDRVRKFAYQTEPTQAQVLVSEASSAGVQETQRREGQRTKRRRFPEVGKRQTWCADKNCCRKTLRGYRATNRIPLHPLYARGVILEIENLIETYRAIIYFQTSTFNFGIELNICIRKMLCAHEDCAWYFEYLHS